MGNANDGISLGRGTNSARAGIDYQDKAFGNLGDLLNTGSIGSIGNGGQIGISAGQGHTYNRQFGRFRRPSSPGRLAGGDYEDGIYIGNANNQGHWGNNANTGNNANDGISLGRGTRSRRAGADYLSIDEGLGILARVTGKSPGRKTLSALSLSNGRSGSDYLSLDSAKIIADKKGNGKASMSIDNAKALGFDKDCFPYCKIPSPGGD